MTQHTPGPWKVSNKYTVGNDVGELVAEVIFAPDARLIAAAPRMLRLIERMAKLERVSHKPLVLGTRIELVAIEDEARAILRDVEWESNG